MYWSEGRAEQMNGAAPTIDGDLPDEERGGAASDGYRAAKDKGSEAIGHR